MYSSDDFVDQPKVINGASELMTKVFGDIGIHTRSVQVQIHCL